MLTIIPTFYMIWQNHKKNRLTPKQRLMRNRAAQARLQLDEKFILQEAAHENELKQMETGLDVAESKFDFLSSLKQKGESLLKDKVTQVNKVVDDKLKQTTDKLKVDKFFDKDKKE
jgi:predicted metal-dependent hydrolase